MTALQLRQFVVNCIHEVFVSFWEGYFCHRVSSKEMVNSSGNLIWTSRSLTVSWLVGCWSFTSLKHIRSSQDENRLVALHTHGNFIVLPDLKNQDPGTMVQYPAQSHYHDNELASSCPILLKLSTRLGSNNFKWFKLSVWLGKKPNSRSLACEARNLTIRLKRPGRS